MIFYQTFKNKCLSISLPCVATKTVVFSAVSVREFLPFKPTYLHFQETEIFELYLYMFLTTKVIKQIKKAIKRNKIY